MKHRSMLWALLIGGSIAGVLDILFAIVSAGYSGVSPTQVLHAVASGLLGKAAFSGGMPVAALGLALHSCCRSGGPVCFSSRLGACPY